MEESIEDWPVSNRVKTCLLDNGYVNVDSLKDLTLDELKNIDGLGEKSIIEIREYLYAKYKIVFRKKQKKKKLDNASTCKVLIEHFLKDKPINWGMEMLKANKLLKERSLEEWLKIPPFEKMYTLGFFLHDMGKKYLEENIPKKLVMEEKKFEEVSETVAENYEEKTSAPISLRDFLKLR